MFFEFDDLENFLKVVLRYNTFRVYRVLFNSIEALAQSQKNTYYLFITVGNKKELERIVKKLEKNGFIRVKEIKRWEG